MKEIAIAKAAVIRSVAAVAAAEKHDDKCVIDEVEDALAAAKAAVTVLEVAARHKARVKAKTSTLARLLTSASALTLTRASTLIRASIPARASTPTRASILTRVSTSTRALST